MAEKRKSRKKKEEFCSDGSDKPSKEEYDVAKWMRKNVPTKRTKFLNHNVEYFTAAKAIDALMTSAWAVASGDEEPLFPSRVEVVELLDKMLQHKFFHRAKKIPVSELELKAKLKKKEKKGEPDKRSKKSEEEAESSHAENDKKDDKQLQISQDEKEKKKRKVRLEMHLDQVFVDGLDAYVWIYDPIPVYYWFFGTLMVLGAIAVCLFPLWPPIVRKGVYYLSVAAAGFLIFIIGLAILRLVVFCTIWLLTLGKHHLWLLPNLTEDVGFLPSFWPIYQYEYKGEPEKKSKKKKKDKDSDNENEDDQQDSEGNDNGKSEDERSLDPDTAGECAEENSVIDEKEAGNSESESESSQKSQTGKDFEIVEKEEFEEKEGVKS